MIKKSFYEKPSCIISYVTIEDISYLLGVKISNKFQYKFLERFKKKHDDFWISRGFIQYSLVYWNNESQSPEISFRIMSRR